MEEKKKATYEELENYCNQLSIQNQRLQNKINELNYSNAFTRLEFLFKVVQSSDKFRTDFVVECVEEIEKMISIPKEEVKEEE